jgi:hypothetical protein
LRATTAPRPEPARDGLEAEPLPGQQEAPHVRRAAMFTGASAFQMGLIRIIAGMMGAGVFERYPRLRLSLRGSETSCGCDRD